MSTPVPSRLRWLCRRGMRELDLMLERSLRDLYPQLPAAQQQLFAQLLEQVDQDLLDWITGRSTPPAKFEALVSRMQQLLVPNRSTSES